MVFGWPSRKTSYLYLMYVSMASCMVSKEILLWIERLNSYTQYSIYIFTKSICMLIWFYELNDWIRIHKICSIHSWSQFKCWYYFVVQFCTFFYCVFKYMFTGDWLYMLFMHQACVYATKEQNVKSNEILTAVVKEALLKGRINDILS